MYRISTILAVLVLLITPSALAKQKHHSPPPKHQHHQPAPKPPVTPPVVPPVLSVSETSFQAYTTSWAALDNTPAGSDIQFDGTHSGGTGTYQDPISLASGYILNGNTPVFDYPIGTMFYIPNLQRYFVSSDECGGDGNSNPANTPCHKSEMPPYPQVDLWAGNSTDKAVLKCEDSITGIHTLIENPVSTYPVTIGSLYNGTCTQQFGN